MRTLWALPPRRQIRNARETLDIFAPLANRLGIWRFKWELEDLAFRYLNWDLYQQIAKLLAERRAERQEYVDKVVQLAKEALAQEGVEATVYGRPKHIYSIYRKMQEKNRDFDQIPVPAPALAELLRLIDEGTISGKIAKTVFDEMAASGRTAAAIVAERGLVQISDAGQIGAVVDRILAANAGQVEAYRSGKTKIFGFFVGQVMRETRGKANPKVVNDLLREKLGAG